MYLCKNLVCQLVLSFMASNMTLFLFVAFLLRLVSLKGALIVHLLQ